MPLPLLAIAQGVGTGLNFLNNFMNRPKPFGDTTYGKRLKMLSEQGTFSGAAKSNILGGVGKETGNVAQQAKVGYKGRLISQGMGGSIAGQAKLADIDVQRMNQMGDAAQKIETENELSKVQYGNEYAQAATQYGQQRQDYDRNMLTGLVQGTVGALGTYAQGLQQREQREMTGENYKDSGMNKSEWIKTYISAYNAKTARDQVSQRYPQITPLPENILQMNPVDQKKWIMQNAKSPDELAIYQEMLWDMRK